MKVKAPILLIETSTERAIVGIAQDQTILYQQELPLGLNNSKYLAPAIEEGLKCLGINLKDAGAIAVGVGPGSYTGIRVGAILAKALAFTAEIPLVGLCTLQCFSPPSDGPFTVLIDAKISGVYHISGVKERGAVIFTSEPQVIPLPQLDSLLSQHSLIITPQAKVLQPKLEALTPQALWLQLPPNLLQMASLAQDKLARGLTAEDGSLELLYLRKTQAEIEKQEKII